MVPLSSDQPLVSCDFNGSSYSSIVDVAMTKTMEPNLVKVLAWYANEMGFFGVGEKIKEVVIL